MYTDIAQTGPSSGISPTPTDLQSRIVVDEELRRYSDILPDLRCLSWDRCSATCPFCGEGLILEANYNFKFYWKCLSRCKGSRLDRDDGTYHSGDISDLERLVAAERTFRLLQSRLVELLQPGSRGLKVGMAVLETARLRVIPLEKTPMVLSLREIAGVDPSLDIVKKDNNLRSGGYHIRKGIGELQEVGVVMGEARSLTVGRRRPFKRGTSAFDFGPLLNEAGEPEGL